MVIALCVILWLNAGVLLGPSFRPPPAIARASLAVGLHQEWGMFAPGPPKGDSWLVFEGTLAGGRKVDALSAGTGGAASDASAGGAASDASARGAASDAGAPVDWERPLPSPFPGSPGENFTSSVIEPLYEPERRYLARWICRRWNEARPGDPMEAIRIHFVIREIALPGGAPRPLEAYLLWERPCAD